MYWRYADWSEPTAIAAVGRSERIIAGATKSATVGRARLADGKTISFPSTTSEPSMEAIVIGFAKEHMMDVPGKVAKLTRGSVANFKKKNVELVDPKIRMLRKVPEHEFRSDMLVVDISGGKELPKTKRKVDKGLRQPGEMLVFTAGGQLEVHREYDDAHEFYYNDYPEPEAGAYGVGGGYGAGYGGEGEDDDKKKRRRRRGGGGYGY